MEDHLTILRSLNGYLTKQIVRSSSGQLTVIPFDNVTYYAIDQIPVFSSAGLFSALQEISTNPNLAIIRGEPLPGTNHMRCRRLCAPQDGEACTFEAKARSWLALDIDALPESEYAAERFAKHPEIGVEYARYKLPAEFADEPCWWQATASAGIKPGIRCRLWFWLDRVVTDGEAKFWLRQSPVDCSLFTPVALHYTAAPVFGEGVVDPVVRRSGTLNW